jgi:hypothetical protein
MHARMAVTEPVIVRPGTGPLVPAAGLPCRGRARLPGRSSLRNGNGRSGPPAGTPGGTHTPPTISRRDRLHERDRSASAGLARHSPASGRDLSEQGLSERAIRRPDLSRRPTKHPSTKHPSTKHPSTRRRSTRRRPPTRRHMSGGRRGRGQASRGRPAPAPGLLMMAGRQGPRPGGRGPPDRHPGAGPMPPARSPSSGQAAEWRSARSSPG